MNAVIGEACVVIVSIADVSDGIVSASQRTIDSLWRRQPFGPNLLRLREFSGMLFASPFATSARLSQMLAPNRLIVVLCSLHNSAR